MNEIEKLQAFVERNPEAKTVGFFGRTSAGYECTVLASVPVSCEAASWTEDTAEALVAAAEAAGFAIGDVELVERLCSTSEMWAKRRAPRQVRAQS